MSVLNAFLVAAVTVFLLTCGLLRTSFFSHVMDRPNERSLHAVPIPRIGGIAIVAGILFAWGLADALLTPLWLCVLGLGVLSFADDLKGLGIAFRLSGHAAAAGFFIFWLPLQWEYYLYGFAILAMMWMTNLYNFMDGSDGLAGGMAVLGFGSYAIAASMGNDLLLASLSISIVAATLAFLWFNFHPARIFMGDVGSIPLGFLAGALGLLGWSRGDWESWFPIMVFSPFIVDASVTLAKRMIRGEKFWQAHCCHYYQRLIQLGWGHRRTALFEYGLMLLAGTTAIALLHQALAVQVAVGMAWLLLYAGLMIKIDRMWQRAANALARA
jgi:UDP-GlcNAc:undecaprenyl-phosphate/decaprenyl-phosphate GlcNAc-1-phosphate transferase